MKEIREERLNEQVTVLNTQKEGKTKVYLKDKVFILPTEKIQHNSDIFQLNEYTLQYQINEEKKENIDKFFHIFKDDLLNAENANNIAEIISFYLIKQTQPNTQNTDIKPSNHDHSNYTDNKNIHLSDRKSGYSHLYLKSNYRYFKPKFSYRAVKHLVFPSIFFSRQNLSSVYFLNPKMLREVNYRFMKNSYGYLNLLESFFSDKKKNPFNLQYFLENKQYDSKIVSKEALIIEQRIEAQRFLLANFNEQFSRMNQEAILIQKCVRGYLLNRRIVKNYQEIFLAELNKVTILIQKNFRRYYCKIKYKKEIINDKIKQMIKGHQEKIFSMIRSYQLKKNLRLSIVIKKIRQMQVKKVIKIQQYVRNHLLKIYTKKLLDLEKSHYKLTYPFKAKTVQIKIFMNQWDYKIFDFYYCKVQEIFVVYIDPIWFLKDRYRVQFIVDDCVTCDGSYPHIEFNDGNYYNVIDFYVMESKLKKTTGINETQSTINSDDDSFISYR